MEETKMRFRIPKGERDWVERGGKYFSCTQCGESYYDREHSTPDIDDGGGAVIRGDFFPDHKICRKCFWEKERETEDAKKAACDRKWEKLISLFGDPPKAVAVSKPYHFEKDGKEEILGEVIFYRDRNKIRPIPCLAQANRYRQGSVEISSADDIFLG
jgi:hypothetical protein